MSKVLGIISEYNPFHNGHLHHLNESIKALSPDYTVCIMSGNFVQRGDTALMDKWARTEVAIKCGIDLVIELPTVYAISSAENFALGAVKILDSISKNAILSFGSESGQLSVLEEFADILYSSPPEYVSLLNHELSVGNSYPKARENALLMYLNDIRKYANVLSSPNNILGIEYLKAIRILKSNITPYTIKRKSVNYNDKKSIDGFASSTAIRTFLSQDKDVKKLLPKESYNILLDMINHGKVVNSLSLFEKEILYVLRKMSIKELSGIADVTEGLENRIKEASNRCNNLEDLISLIKSKRYTRTRIQRILLYCLLRYY